MSELAAALDKALETLGEEKYQHLSGSDSQVKVGRRSTLLENSSPAARTATDLVLDRVLGPRQEIDWKSIDLLPDLSTEANQDLSDIVSERFEVMRRRMDWLDTPGGAVLNETDHDVAIGMTSDGTPIWREVLDESRQRLLSRLEEPTAPIYRDTVGNHPDWPEEMMKNPRLSFATFHVCPENLSAARSMDRVLDEPGRNWNPIMIQGQTGTGKSHLIWATSAQMARQDPSRRVRYIDPDQVSGTPPEGWHRAFRDTSMLIVEDLELFHESHHQFLGEVIDRALNNGTQVIISCGESALDELPPSRLKNIMSEVRSVRLRRPGRTSRITFLRELSSSRRLLLRDSHLEILERESGVSWRSLAQTMEKLGEAIERGMPFDHENEILDILGDRTIKERDESEYQGVDVGTLVAEAVENAIHEPLQPDIEIFSSMDILGEDDYEVPDLIPVDSRNAVDSLVQRHLGEELERMARPVGQAISVHEKEKHLVQERSSPSADELVRVKNDLSGLDDHLDRRFQQAEQAAHDERQHLTRLLDELQTLSEAMVDAGTRDLIRLVDRLYSIELELHRLDPERWPVPEMPSTRRRATRREPEPEPEPEPEEDTGPQHGNVSVASLRPLTILEAHEEE